MSKSKAEKQAATAAAAKAIPPAKGEPKAPPVNHAEEKEEKPAAAVELPKVKTGKIAEILELHKSGKTNAEIKALGYHPTTVSIQVTKFKKTNGTWEKEKAVKDAAKLAEKERKVKDAADKKAVADAKKDADVKEAAEKKAAEKALANAPAEQQTV